MNDIYENYIEMKYMYILAMISTFSWLYNKRNTTRGTSNIYGMYSIIKKCLTLQFSTPR